MPKASKKSGHLTQTPYTKASTGAAKLANNVFKMNKDLGQHILKNPGVAQAIVDKAGLKQSDVRRSFIGIIHLQRSNYPADCPRSWSGYWKLDSPHS